MIPHKKDYFAEIVMLNYHKSNGAESKHGRKKLKHPSTPLWMTAFAPFYGD